MTIAMKSVAVQAAELEPEAIREDPEDVDAGRTVRMDAMDQWLDSIETPSELPAPKAGTVEG